MAVVSVNIILNWLAQYIAVDLRNSNLFAKMSMTELITDFNESPNGYKKGQTIYTQTPARFKSQRNNLDISAMYKGFAVPQIPVTMDQTSTITVEVGALDETFKLWDGNAFQPTDKWRDLVVRPIVHQLSNDIDSYLAEQIYKNTYQMVGTPYGQINSINPFNAISRILANNGYNDGGPSNNASQSVLKDVIGLFSPLSLEQIQNSTSLTAYFDQLLARDLLEGSLMRLAKTNIFGDQNVKTHTSGNNLSTTVTVNTTSVDSIFGATTGTIALTGLTASTTNAVVVGDILEVADTYMTNPVNRESVGTLQQYVVTTNANSDGSGNATVTVMPPIFSPTASTEAQRFQNVTQVPTAGKAVNILTLRSAAGTYAAGQKSMQNIAFMREAFSFVSAPLDFSNFSVLSAVGTEDNISLRVSAGNNINDLTSTTRWDILFGCKVIRPEFCVRVIGSTASS